MKFNCYRYQLCIDNGIIRSVRCSNLDLCMKDNQKFSNELSELILKLRKYVV